jgi:hypothetical protein
VVLCLVFFVLAGNSFWCFIHMVLIVQYSCAVVSVFCSGGKSVLVLHSTYVLRVQYNCGVELVFWSWREIVIDFTYVFSVQYSGNSSQNENTFLQKNLIGLLYYDPIADVCIHQTLFYSVSFYFGYFSCTTQICTLKFKSEYYLRINIGDCVKNANTGNHTLIS